MGLFASESEQKKQNYQTKSSCLYMLKKERKIVRSVGAEHNSARVVIVTGGSRGIGLGIAECFAKNGDSLVIADIDFNSASEAVAHLQATGAAPSLAFRCDITKPSQVSSMIRKVIRHHGRIDVLVNNAGICPFIEVMDMSSSVWKRTIDVNLTGAFFCTKAVASEMIHLGIRGRIIFITSLAENVTDPRQVDYGASKAGLRMAMVGFSSALGKHGITCNAVAPGMIMTSMTEFHWKKPKNLKMIRTRVPMGRLGTPADIGHAVMFLASKDSEYISGISLRVDGGHQTRCV